MSLYLPPLEATERQQLQILLAQQPDKRMAQRVQVVLLSADGMLVPEISQLVGLHPINVRKWIHRFRQQGVAGLCSGKSPGRPRLFTPQQEQRILELAQIHPTSLGLSFKRWTLPKLRRYLVEQGVVKQISIESLRQLLQKYQLSVIRRRPQKYS
jgi:transposase